MLKLNFIFLFGIFGILVASDRLFYPSESFSNQAHVSDGQLFIESEQEGFEKFWENRAKEIPWFKSWDRVLDWKPPYSKWFIGGELNASYVCLDHNLKQGNKDRIALIWVPENGQERQVTYQELFEETCRFANVLKSLGVRKGDKVALYMPIMPDTIAAMLACARIGAAHLVIFGGIGQGGIKERILNSEAKVVITVDGGYRRGKLLPFKKIVSDAIQDCPSVEHVVVLKRTGNVVDFNDKHDVWYHDLSKTVSSYCLAEPMESEDLLFILYTSGTTGKPKGIMHTTGGFLVGVHQTFKWVFDYKKSDIYWCTADMGWITGNSYVVYGPLSNGATQVIYEGAPDYPDKSRVWEIIEKHKVSIFYTAPTLIRTFIQWGDDWLKKYDLSSIRLLGSIGEPINPEVWKWYRENVGNGISPIVDTWFQTETGAFVIAPLPGYTPLKPGSVTHPLPGYEVKILNEQGEKVKNGFLAITQPFPSMLRGIYKDPQRFVSTYWSKWDGKYYFAGDGAMEDEDGYLWVYGRVDDVIKISGHRIGSAEIENVALEHPSIAECAAVGIPDHIKGEEILVFAVIRDQFKENKEIKNEISRHLTNHFGSYAKPKDIIFVPQLPKNRSGKILRRVLRNLIMNEAVGDLTTLDNISSIDEIRLKIK